MRLTRHSERHHCSDLPLEAVGGHAHVVAGVAAGDFGEDELAAPLLHAGRELSSVCRGETEVQAEMVREGGGGLRICYKHRCRGETIDDDDESPIVFVGNCKFTSGRRIYHL